MKSRCVEPFGKMRGYESEMAARRELEREMDNGTIANGRKILINVGG